MSIADSSGGGFRPQFWPTLVFVPALAFLISLGMWQLDRLAWKTDLIERIEMRTAAAAMPLPARLSDPDTFDYRRVTVTGRFLYDREMYLPGRVYRGMAGFHVVTPLDRGYGTAPVLVNRGWVPADRSSLEARPAGQLAGEVTIEGIARTPAAPGRWTPENRPADRIWYYYDLPAMARVAGLSEPLPVYVEAGPAENPGGFPIGGQTRIDFPNNHLGYALSWFAMALGLAVVYCLSQWRRG